ncbi:TadE/TadG family type IV pilus assembly protein [Muricoccus radiodurans]|uniref:TadE/TadG family type IV pilus assembly protein n=1 Tax=Muricoccus radiodurans TaxID=2231721 RepID=UPI003CFA2518
MSPIPPTRAGRRGIRSGSAAVEFALLLPFLLILFVATAEAVGYLRTWYRLEQAASSAASAASRLEVMNTTAVSGLFEAARAVADPYIAWNTGPSMTAARTVISAISSPSGSNVVAWTCSRGDAGLAPRVAGTASIPGGFVLPTGESVVVVEIVNDTAPWMVMAGTAFFGTAGPRPLRAYAIARPRATEAGTLTGGCP